MSVDLIDHFKSLFIFKDFKTTESAACLLAVWGKCSWSVTWEQLSLTHNRNLPLQILKWLLRKTFKLEAHLESLTATRITPGLKSGRHPILGGNNLPF